MKKNAFRGSGFSVQRFRVEDKWPQAAGVRHTAQSSKLKAQRLIGEKANRLEGYKA
jgi:hypothetical protein